MADLKTTNIYGDAYINNKVGIATNAPATRLQIGQLSPTAATEGIQFGDDTGARLYRGGSSYIQASAGFQAGAQIYASTYLQSGNSQMYPSGYTSTQRFGVGNASGNAWIDGLTIAQGGNVTVYNNLTVNNAATVTNDLTVNGNTYLGNANNDTVYVNDTIRIGATDSGDASLFFGEGAVAGSDYGARWYWDSGYTFTWYTRNNGTDTALFDYVTNDLNYINWRRHFHMQNKEINYSSQVHFNAGTRFVGNDTQYLIFRSDSTGVGGIQIQDGGITTKGYVGYWDSGGGGILNNTGNWSLRYNFGNANSGGTLYGAWVVNGNISATNLSGTNTGDQTVGNGTITIAAGSGIGVGTSNTFTTNQTGATTVTISNNGVTSLTTNTGLSSNVTATGAVTVTNTGVTSNVAGTGISVSGATGAVTITNSGVTSLAGTTNRITVSGATGAVILNLPQDIHTGASPTFAGLSLTSVSTTGATITNLTGAYQNTSVYDSAKTQSATPSRGIRAPASSIQFTDSYAIAPFYTYRSTGDWPVPYGIGWGTGGESSGIFQRYASNGSSFGDMIFYTGNDGYGAFSFRRHTWEGTAQLAAGSGELNTELFRVDWAGNLTMLGTLNGSANSATLYANPSNYGSWKIGGTRNGWYGIEFESGTNLMANSNEVGFYRNGSGWQLRWSNGVGYVYKGAPGGGTEATILDSSNQAYAWNMNQNVRSTDSPTFGTLQLTRLNFGASAAAPYAAASGEGFGNGITFGGDENSAAYRIFTGMENIGGNYSKLTLNWHTGIRIGAYYGYGGIRFYDNFVGSGTKVFSIAESDSNVRVYNELFVQGGGIGSYGFLKYGGTRSGDWQLFTTSSGQINVVQVENFGAGGHTNYPTGVYTYGGVMSWRLPNHSFQLYAAHTGDLAYKTQWNNDNYSGWRRILDSSTYPYAANMNQYVRTTDTCSFAGLTVSNTINGSVTGNAGTVTNGLYTTGGQTIAGITYFSNGESINAYGIRGRFTNEYLHLYNKVGVGHPGGWGAGESSTPDKGLSTYGGLNIAYGDNGLSTFNGVIRANSNIRQGADLARPLANWSVSGTSTGMVIFSFPGNTGNYGMVHCVFDIYEYNSNTVSTVIVGGHNWSGAWYNIGANVIGRCGKSVRLGVKDSKFCVVFGGAASSWEYGTIILRKIHNGGFYTGIMDMGGSFTTQQTTTESFSNISGDLRLLRTSADFIADGGVTGTSFSGAGTGLTGTASSLSIGGNAATATNLTTNRTNWSTNGTITAVVGQLSWKHYGNNHTIIDASNSTAPDGTAINNTNPGTAWSGTYPTLMGWNGSSTYGVRVDSSRYADQVGYSPNRTDSTAYAVLWGAGSTNTIAYSCAAVTIQSSTGTLTATSFSGAGTGLTGTASSLSIGGNAVTVGGLAVHGGRNNETNKIVRTDSNGYIQAGWINTPSGDMADTQSINKIYCSDDDYVRYKGVADFKQQIGLTYKNSTPRSTSTTDTNYWTGMMGWGTTDFNTMITWGCGFIDSWASPGNSPGAGYTHFVGVQALHYTNGDTDGTDNYGYQLVAGSGVNSPLFLRVNWGSAGSWKTMLDSLNFNSYSPSLTGNGASGNWAINVTGNAATVTNGIYTTNYWTGTPLGKRRNRIHSADSTSLNSSITNLECGFTYGGSGEPTGPFIAFGGLGGSIDYSCQLVGAYSGGGNDFKIRTRNDDTATWNTWRTIVTDGNYTSYSPTLTGTGASGTWAISITGNAATVTNGLYTNSSLTAGNLSGTIPSGVLGNSTHYIGTTAITLNRTSSSQTLTGVSIDGNAATATSATSATYLNSSNYIARCGSSGNANTDFQNTPAGSVRHNGDDSNLTNSPGGTWWFYDNYRHSNNSNYWGIQVAWGWEDQANKLATRNITGGTFGGWVYYLNSNNYTDYTVTKTGTGASGTWGINITGNAATATTATNVTIANGSVTLAKIENITAYTILGNSNASAAATPAALSVATVATMLSGQTMNINGSSTSISGFGNPTTAASGNTIAYRDGNGDLSTRYFFGSYVNSSDDISTGNISHIMAKFGDNYYRSATAAKVAAFITGQTMNINGSSTSCSGNAATATLATKASTLSQGGGNGTGMTFNWSGQSGQPTWLWGSNDGTNIYVWNPSNFNVNSATSATTATTATTANALNTANNYQVANLGIGVAPSNKLHVDGGSPAAGTAGIRIDNAGYLTGVASNNKATFYGYLPLKVSATVTVYIRLWQ